MYSNSIFRYSKVYADMPEYMWVYAGMCVFVGMYLRRPAVAGRRVWYRRSCLLLRVRRRWMVLVASILVYLATAASATGIRVRVIDSWKPVEGAPPAADRSSPPPSPQGGDRRTIHWTWDGPHSDRTLSGHRLPWPLDVCES